MGLIITFIVGLLIGFFLALAAFKMTGKQQDISETLKDSFKALSSDVLSQSTKTFLDLAKQTLATQSKEGEKDLEGKKQLIDQSIGNMEKQLKSVTDQIATYQKEYKNIHGEVSEKLKSHAEQTQKLQDTTNKLQSVLASTKARGQWGERMAEDVLRLAGFIEGVNYKKQKALDASAKRPDYTFFLPNNSILNMDVKFPLNSYLHYVASENEVEKKAYLEQFLRDVRSRIKEVTTRDYISPADNTVDYVIVFIPNEQVYSFINQTDVSIIDEALKNKVIFCSPLTLYAILAVIRQAMDNFKLEKTAGNILSLLGLFNKRWGAFVKTMEDIGGKIKAADESFEMLVSTRKKMLDVSLRKIEEIREEEGIKLPKDDDLKLLDAGQ